MRIIRTNTLTIEQFLEKLRIRTTFTSQDNMDYSEVIVRFPVTFKWGDGSERISSLCLEYDSHTRNITRITITGSNLIQIIGYTYINECYLWFTIKDMTQFDFSRVEDNPAVLIINL